jgi:hypothetical protein
MMKVNGIYNRYITRCHHDIIFYFIQECSVTGREEVQ